MPCLTFPQNSRTADVQLTYREALLAGLRRADAEPHLRAAHATLQNHREDQPRLAAQAAAALSTLRASA